MPSTRTLGTLLRALIERLDNAVEVAYADAKLDFRARYTPVFRSVLGLKAASIQELADNAGLTHSATSQTVAQMRKAGLVSVRRGKKDARERIVSLTTQAQNMVPKLRSIWAVTNAAAQALENELAHPLSSLLEQGLTALNRLSFEERRLAVSKKGNKQRSPLRKAKP
jgi:DNA-binding MarR family transcriptional regulator